MFSISAYGALLSKAKKVKKLYLRHDVDISLLAALTLSRFERDRGVSSTYFLLVNGETYNLFSDSSKKIVTEIINAGHEIGLHFDPVGCSDPVFEIKRHFDLLKEATGVEAKAFTLHRPAAYARLGLHAKEITLPGKENWYQPPFFTEGAYLSDSNHRFRVGDPLQFLEQFQGRALQLLIHPEWWIGEGEPLEKIFRLKKEEEERFDAALKGTLSFYKESH